MLISMKENVQRYGSKIEMLERDQVLMTGGETKLADLVDSPLMFVKGNAPKPNIVQSKRFLLESFDLVFYVY